MNCLTNRGSLLWSILVSLILTVASAQAGTPKLDIVETAVSAKSFNTLLAAATAAGLVENLKSPGPLTVFAPTDEAFAKLPKGAVESLLKPENKDKLVAILTLHVLPDGSWRRRSSMPPS